MEATGKFWLLTASTGTWLPMEICVFVVSWIQGDVNCLQNNGVDFWGSASGLLSSLQPRVNQAGRGGDDKDLEDTQGWWQHHGKSSWNTVTGSAWQILPAIHGDRPRSAGREPRV